MTTSSKSGFFSSALSAFVSARERQAQRYVNGVLLSLDDETLAGLGYSRKDLKNRPSAPPMF